MATIALVPLTLAVRSANTTPSPTTVLCAIGILFAEFMATSTMRSLVVLGRRGITSKAILPMAHDLHVRWIAAGWIAAEVIEFLSLGNRTGDGLIDQTVGSTHLSINQHLAVTMTQAAGDVPAAIVLNLDFLPDSLKHSLFDTLAH